MLLPKQRLGFLGLLVWDWGFRGTGRRSELTYQVICWVFWGFRFGTGVLGGQAEGQSFNHPYQRLGFYGALGLGLGDFRFGTGALGGQAEGQSFNHPYQRLGFYGNMGDSIGPAKAKEVQNMSPQKLSFVIPTLFWRPEHQTQQRWPHVQVLESMHISTGTIYILASLHKISLWQRQWKCKSKLCTLARLLYGNISWY